MSSCACRVSVIQVWWQTGLFEWREGHFNFLLQQTYSIVSDISGVQDVAVSFYVHLQLTTFSKCSIEAYWCMDYPLSTYSSYVILPCLFFALDTQYYMYISVLFQTVWILEGLCVGLAALQVLTHVAEVWFVCFLLLCVCSLLHSCICESRLFSNLHSCKIELFLFRVSVYG